MHGARDIDHKDEFSGWNILLPDPFRRLHHQQEKLFVFVLKKHESRLDFFTGQAEAQDKVPIPTECFGIFQGDGRNRVALPKNIGFMGGVTTSCRAIPVEIFAVILNFVSGLLPCGRYGLLIHRSVSSAFASVDSNSADRQPWDRRTRRCRLSAPAIRCNSARYRWYRLA